MFRSIRNFFRSLFKSPPGRGTTVELTSVPRTGGDFSVPEPPSDGQVEDEEMKYLIVGLGNYAIEYVGTRHNIGFDVVDHIAAEAEAMWESKRLVEYTMVKKRGKQIHMIKPTTFMNRSGRAVRYWLDHLKLSPDKMIVVVDDLHLQLGTLRIRQKGGDGGHNGLRDINEVLGNSNWARLRFGIGNDFGQGQQVNFVLGKWEEEELPEVRKQIVQAAKASLDYHLLGSSRAMERYNRK